LLPNDLILKEHHYGVGKKETIILVWRKTWYVEVIYDIKVPPNWEHELIAWKS